jgi:DNA polymerase-3 subunit delta
VTPEQFIDRIKKHGPAPAYLFLGPEGYLRSRCREALLAAALDPEERESGYTVHDLDQTTLAAVLDDARSLSLFASRRVIWVRGAEAALPRTRASASDGDAPAGGSQLAPYLASPTPGVVVIFDVSRYDFGNDDKARVEQVRKFFAAVEAVVEFKPFTPEAARALAQSLARQAELKLGLAELALLLEATAGDASRLAMEIEKLRLFCGTERKVTAEDIAALVPDAQATNTFALVAALGRGDRSRALELLDTLVRQGDYMPLALTFLATQFRMALVAREANLRGASQILAHFNRIGGRMWPDRARQVEETVNAFPKARLERAMTKVFETDRALRDRPPDERIVMEEMILSLTAREGGL